MKDGATMLDAAPSESNPTLFGGGVGDREFLFSFIVPVYNTERYLDEAIESLVNQTIGFEDNIEIVLINDGSTDRSLEICQKWAADFPRNIQVIDKKNEGVSVARNVGFAASRGRYVNFFDSDDRWSLDWCEEAFAFFVENPGIGIVGARHTFFGAQEGPHLLSWKYKSDGVVDIDKSPDRFLHTVNNLFIRRNLVEPFLPGLEVSEDFRNINEVISKTRKYGVLSVPRYWYRRRTDGSSAINLSTTNRSFYLKSPVDVYEYLFDSNRNLDGSVPRFLQNAVMYDLQWRVKREKPACL